MFISKQWLTQFIEGGVELSPEKIAEELKMKTVEVENIEYQGAQLENIVIGKIVSVEKHPDADRLSVCRVDIGETELTVVCGGSNLSVGMKVAVGKIGAKVKWHGEGELVELQKTKIRGVESSGMICASTEIGLGELFPTKEEKEIFDLSALTTDSVVGQPVAKILGLDDVILEIDNKSMSHRPDLWGHYGLAREVAAIFEKKFAVYEVPKIKSGNGIDINVEVEAKDLCPRYMAVVLSGITVASSPAWLQNKLSAVGLRPINNIVDITNYVMLELGQPMHVFDVAKVARGKEQKAIGIEVRRAESGEKFITLDKKEYELTSEMLVIADSDKALAIAGVMGGENSGIADETTEIIFEAATFNAVSVRKTSTRLGLRTDSSSRFEKTLDAVNAELALSKAVELTLQICPEAKVVSKVIDVKNFTESQKQIELSLDWMNKKIGVEIKRDVVIDILERLGFGVKEKKDVLFVTVPTWRATKDISIAEDLVEEVSRFYGYNNITSSLPTFSITPPVSNRLRTMERKIKDLLAYEHSYTEVYNYSFENAEWLKKIGKDVSKYLELDNPIAKDRPYLRRGLTPNLLQNVESNAHRFDSLKLFEIGRVYDKEETGDTVQPGQSDLLPKQDLILGMVCADKKIDNPFYEVSSAIGQILNNVCGNYSIKKVSAPNAIFHPGRCADVFLGSTFLGSVGELNPLVQEKLGIPYRVALLELNLSILVDLTNDKSEYSPVFAYPAVVRDVAFVVDKTVEHAAVVGALKKINALVGDVQLFDVYLGKNLAAGKKSMAYHIVYQSADHTLLSAEVDAAHEKVLQKLEKEFGAEVRK